MSTGIVGAEIQDKQDCFERENVNILIFANIVFSLLSNKEKSKKCNCSQNQCKDGAIADVVKEHPCYQSNISLEKNPDKIYAFECDIQCHDLYCDENGKCIDPIGAFSKILYACNRFDNFLKEFVFPPDSNIQVCINVLGFEPISDIVWGFAFMSDACCPNNVEDEALNELIMDEYEPFFLDYIKSNWKVNVVYISLMDYDMVFEITNHNVDDDSKQKANLSKRHSNLNQKNHNSHTIDERNTSIVKDILQNSEVEKDPITLEGHISKTEVNLSSFFSFNHILDCIPPFNVVRFLDRLTGVDIIENKIRKSARNSIEAYIRGDFSEGWRNLKEAGGTSLDYVHKRLEVISFVPGAGTIAGVADGVLYTIQEGYIGFTTGDMDEVERLKKQALWAYTGAIPFAKIIKYGKPIIKSGKAIAIGSKNVTRAKKELSLAREAYEEANKAKKALKGATKAQRKHAISNRYAQKQAKRNAEDALERARSNPEYQNALKEYGITYKEAITNYRELFNDTLRALGKRNTPIGDILQSIIIQGANNGSSTRETLRNRRNPD